MGGYDLSDTLPATGVAESSPRPGGRPRPQAPWPFANISPAQLDALTPDERIGLEAMAATYIEQALRIRRGAKPRGRKATG